VTRTTEALARIEQALEHVTETLARLEGRPHPATPPDLAAVTADARAARQSSEAAFAGVQALAALAVAPPAPEAVRDDPAPAGRQPGTRKG